MKRIQNRLGSLFTAAVMLLSLAVTPAMAADTQAPPTKAPTVSKGWSFDQYKCAIDFTYSQSDWVGKISKIEIDGKEWTRVTSAYSITNETYQILENDGQIRFGDGFAAEEVLCKITADGYETLCLKINTADKTATIVQDSSNSSGSETPEKKTINVSDVKFESSSSGSDWYVTFGTESDNYINAIKGITVNNVEWESRSTPPYTGGSYCKYNRNYMNNTKTPVLAFAQKRYSSSGTDVLKSGDIITITADGYNDLTFKLVIDKSGSATVSSDTTPGDIYQLVVKIEGNFEAAIVGQKNYDGVSSASVGGASSNKNSAVTVYGALVKKGTEPADNDWEELDHQSQISLNGSKCSVSIVPDTEKGTPAAADSGMKGVYMTLSSDLTLNGTPKDAGSYLVSVHIEDAQGRIADSNTLPFRIYTGEETLADQIQTKNLKPYSNGLYAWDIMEPWAIKNFGSNVDGETESVRVPEKLEVWYGSHESGTYGVLGYDIPWKDVKESNIPQTLYIPDGCNLTLMNMKILSSVRIVVESGGKLTLRDSVVQGIIDVQSGGTFSMNYDSYEGKFLTGASICGQLRLENGAVLENAAIYSHTNYLANGNLTDRSNDKAVVAASGNVTVKGQVFIQGDEAGSTGKGQTALSVSNGTLTMEDNAILVTYGGGGNVTLYSNGGSAVELDNGSIAGKGKLVAIGGPVLFGSGDEAVAGTGSIDVSEVFLQGATAYEHKKGAQPGKAYANSVTVKAGKQHIANGTLVDGAANDPLADLYWKSSIDATPDLTKFETKAVETPVTPETNGNGSGSGNSGSSGPSGSKHKTSKPSTTAASRTFEDVSADAYYNDAVEWAVKSGITNGKAEGLFGSNDPCTRAQIVTFLWRAVGSPAPKGTAEVPADVLPGSYCYDAVAWALENGITNGLADGTFGINKTCTRAQSVTFLFRAIGKLVDSTAEFSDVLTDSYYANAVAWAVENGVTNGIGDGLFGSDNDCTRAQIVTFIWRCMK